MVVDFAFLAKFGFGVFINIKLFDFSMPSALCEGHFRLC